MKYLHSFLFIFLFSILSQAQQAGDLVSAELKADVSPGGLVNFINDNTNGSINQDATDYLNNMPLGLVFYKLTYKSRDYYNNLVNATGLVAFPKTNKKLSTILYMPPTTDNREMVPSNLRGTSEVGIILPIIMSASGYIIIAPDYLGMGDGDGTLAYVEQKTAASAGLDMLKAANQFLDSINKVRYEEYFVTGYSQGGHAAMSVVKWNEEHDKEFNFKYLVSAAGPYDLSQTTLVSGVLNQNEYPRTAFIAYLLNTCQTNGYQITSGDWHDVISDEFYAQFMSSAINNEGGLDWGPAEWRDLFQPEFISAITNNNNHIARQCLKANDVYDFYNKTPTTMYSSWFDKTIPPENDIKTKNTQRSYYPWWNWNKYQIKNRSLGPWNHSIGSLPYLFAAIYKFNTKRKGGFFNFYAENTGEYSKGNSLSKINYVPSSIDPKIIGNVSSISLKGVNDKSSFVRKQKLNNTEAHVALVKTVLPNGKTLMFPIAKEKAVDVTGQNVLKFDKEHLILDLSNYNGLVQRVNLIDDENIIKSVEFNVDTKLDNQLSMKKIDLPNFDMIEIVTESNLFTLRPDTKYLNKNLAQVQVVDYNSDSKIIANSEISNIKIYDASGKLFKELKQLGVQSTEIKLNKGFYIFEVTLSNNMKQVVKFLKK